jgi:hypothetical protein
MNRTFLRKSFAVILVLILFPISFADCKKDKPKEKEYYVIDVKQDTDWNYWIVGKGGESFFI